MLKTSSQQTHAHLHHSTTELSLTHIPDIDQTLFQFIDTVHFRLVDSLLHFSPDFGQSDLNYSGSLNASHSSMLVVSYGQCDSALS